MKACKPLEVEVLVQRSIIEEILESPRRRLGTNALGYGAKQLVLTEVVGGPTNT